MPFRYCIHQVGVRHESKLEVYNSEWCRLRVGRNLGRIRWAKHATPREHHRVREGVEVGAVEYDSQEQHNPLGAAARLP